MKSGAYVNAIIVPRYYPLRQSVGNRVVLTDKAPVPSEMSNYI